MEFDLLLHRSGGTHECTPRGAGQRTADADPPYPERGDVLESEFARPTYQQIERLWGDGGDQGDNLVARPNPGGVEAVGTCVCIGRQPPDRFVEIGSTYQKTFGTPDEQRVAARLVDGFACCANPFDGGAEVVERPGCIAGRI